MPAWILMRARTTRAALCMPARCPDPSDFMPTRHPGRGPRHVRVLGRITTPREVSGPRRASGRWYDGVLVERWLARLGTCGGGGERALDAVTNDEHVRKTGEREQLGQAFLCDHQL